MNPENAAEKNGLWLSPLILHCMDLSDGEVMLLSLIEGISSLGKNKGGKSQTVFYGSSQYLSSKLRGNPSENSIDCVINRLVRKGYLIRSSKKFKLYTESGGQEAYKARRVLQINYEKIYEYYENKNQVPDLGEDLEEIYLEEMEGATVSEGSKPNEDIIQKVTDDLINQVTQQELAKQRKAQRKEEQRNATIKRAIDRSDAIKDFLTKNNIPTDGELGKKMRAVVSGNKKNTKLPQPQLKAQLDMLQQMLDKSDIKTISDIVNRHWTSNHMALIYENELNPSMKPKYNNNETPPPSNNSGGRPPADKQTGVKVGNKYMYIDEITPEIFVKHFGSDYFVKPKEAPIDLIEIAARDYFSVLPWDPQKWVDIPDNLNEALDAGQYLDLA